MFLYNFPFDLQFSFQNIHIHSILLYNNAIHLGSIPVNEWTYEAILIDSYIWKVVIYKVKVRNNKNNALMISIDTL